MIGETLDGSMIRLAVCDVETDRVLAAIVEGGPFAMSPDGAMFVTQAYQYDAVTARQMRRYSTRRGSVHALEFSPDGRWLASAWDDGAIVISDVRTWQAVEILNGHTAAVTQLRFAPDSRTLVSASYDQTIRVWTLTLPSP